MNTLRRLVQPPATIPVLDRRRAHLLAWWLLVLLGTAFGLLRAGYYSYAAALTLLYAVFGPWGSLVIDPTVLKGDSVPLTYVVISILLSSILMHPLFTSFLAGIQLIALMYIASTSPASLINWPNLLALIFVPSVLSILANIINQRDLSWGIIFHLTCCHLKRMKMELLNPWSS